MVDASSATAARSCRSRRPCRGSSPPGSTRFPIEEKLLLQDAAVVGKVFWLGARRRRSAARDGASAEAAPARLERKEFVRRERRSSVGGESRVRLPPPARPRRRLRADPARRDGREASARRRVDRVARPARGPRRDARAPLPDRARPRPSGRGRDGGAGGTAAYGCERRRDRAFALSAFPAARRFYGGGGRALARGRRRTAPTSSSMCAGGPLVEPTNRSI